MPEKLRFLFIFIVALVLGCATVGRGATDASKELSFRLLAAEEVRNHFSVSNAPNPFTTSMQISTYRQYLLTAALDLPKTQAGAVEIEAISAYSADTTLITDASTKAEMISYCKSLAGVADMHDKQLAAIDRYYLPGMRLEGRALGREYAVVFISSKPFSPTDRVSAKIFVDGEEKDFDFEVGNVSGIKK